MALIQDRHVIRGINKDISESKFNVEFAFDAHNIRITSRGDDTSLLSVTNELGTELKNLGREIKGIVLGYCVLNNYAVLFTHDNDVDYIYLIEYITGNNLRLSVLYDGGNMPGIHKSLGFDTKYPIETLGIYENENIQKIYWVDGLNQPRVINIKAPKKVRDLWSKTSFDFVQTLELEEIVNVYRRNDSGGIFHSGTIQYAFTYYNKYGQESNIFYTSPVHNISNIDRGAGPEDVIGNSFEISIRNIDTKFEFLRIYSIHRHEKDSDPIVKIVKDVSLQEEFNIDKKIRFDFGFPSNTLKVEDPKGNLVNVDTLDPVHVLGKYNVWKIQDTLFKKLIFPDNSFIPVEFGSIMITEADGGTGISRVILLKAEEDKEKLLTYYVPLHDRLKYIDNGSGGEIVEPNLLKFVGGEYIVFGTMAQKDNTLFLGNAELKRDLIPQDIRKKFQALEVEFYTNSKYTMEDIKDYYPYSNQLLYGNNIKGFKYLEWYRFGILFQHFSGKWSEPIFIRDQYNGPEYEGDTNFSVPMITEPLGIILSSVTGIPNGKLELPTELRYTMYSLGYRKARGVVVFPKLQDKEVLAQGIVCPTMYNVEDRFSNSSFVMPSWYSRPLLQYDINSWKDNTVFYPESPAAVVENENSKFNNNAKDLINMGAWAEFRHNKPLPDCFNKNAEIQCLVALKAPFISEKGSEINSWVANNKENFYIDLNVVTFHSPEIQFNDYILNTDTKGLKFRIVGTVEVSANISDAYLTTTKPPMYKDSIGVYNELISVENYSKNGARNRMTYMGWIDSAAGHGLPFGTALYPWHSQQSLTVDGGGPNESNADKYPRIDKKKLSNLKYSLRTKYFGTKNSPQVWKASLGRHNNYNGITLVNMIAADNRGLVKIQSPKNSGLGTLNYNSNVDKLVTISRSNELYKVPVSDKGNGNFKYLTATKNKGYPKVISSASIVTGSDTHKVFGSSYVGFATDSLSKLDYALAPVRIKYLTGPHAIFAFNYNHDGEQCILPTFRDGYNDSASNLYPNQFTDEELKGHPFWDDKGKSSVIQDVINYSSNHSLFWIGELYREDVPNRFGGISEEAFTLNEWLPAGEPINLRYDNKIYYNQGDTYFQRYDCLKTFTTDENQTNSITDIVSFMVETNVNIDGRYDRNRGQNNNLNMSPKNFNLLNTAYTQDNNYFIYRGVNPNDFKLNTFPNTVTWTKEKFAGENIDTWTNITMASTLDMDGDKGLVESLNTFNNEIYCFQRKGFSNILFNPRVQIPTSDGVPIEISNNMKVLGKRYISNTVGCSNKWSIVESPNGLYFMDNITNSIYLYNQQLKSISDETGFRSWVSKFNNYNSWNPEEFNNIRTYYDSNNNDIYFVSKDECLGYSELLQQFTSFYSYEKVPAMFNINSEFFSIKDNQLWRNFNGEYNNFFGEYKPFDFTIISNQYPHMNKIFSNVDFRASVYDLNNKDTGELPFNYIRVENEYLEAQEYLEMKVGYPSNIKRKFRVWRVNIPRDNREGRRTRISNPWSYITLGNDNPENKKVEFHDLEVKYML